MYWVRYQNSFTIDMMLFTDESGLEQSDTVREFNWHWRGQRSTTRHIYVSGKRFTMIPLMSVYGVIAWDIIEPPDQMPGYHDVRGTDTDQFKLFLKKKVIPHMNPYPYPHSVLCMDRASIHGHPDIIEIDAASNNGVDEVRELIDKVKYSPIKGRYKVYIIDEVHMMTPSAFNALLKTLEEPPSHVIFILATTEPHKIIPTILSRCQRYDFGKVSMKDMHERIERILKEENVSIEPDALSLILQLADGGMRDALSMLDQAIAFNQNTITSADLFNLFGIVSVDEKLTLLEAIGQGNVTRFVQQIDRLIQLGVDEKRFLNDIVDLLKDVLILFKTKNPDLLYRLNESTV